MAFANETRSTSSSLALDLSAAVHHLVQRLADYRAYRSTLAELRALDDRSLADLGIHRSEIHRVAREAIYGATS